MTEAHSIPEPFLPLSWSICAESPEFQIISLPLSSYRWLAFGDLPAHVSLSELVEHIQNQEQQGPLVLRGCHPRLIEQLKGEALLTGREAVLDLRQKHMQRKSLKELARRGSRHGKVIELEKSKISQTKELQTFLTEIYRNYEIPLSYLYRNQWPQSERYWVLQGEEIWALISLIPSGTGAWHTELLMRNPRAPVGVMEALMTDIFEQLFAEGQRYWSLGEVPFFTPSPPPRMRGKLIQWVGKEIDYAYSAEGLYHFKQKFRPQWRPVYLYGWPHLNLRTLAAMFWKCNCYQLVLYKALTRWPPFNQRRTAYAGQTHPYCNAR